METLTMITTIAVALITAVFGPVAVEWSKKKFEKPSKLNIEKPKKGGKKLKKEPCDCDNCDCDDHSICECDDCDCPDCAC